MYLHITFTNGSNPYIQYWKRGGEKLLETKQDVRNALRRWKKNYNITGYWSDTGYMATATEKYPSVLF